MKIVTRFLPSNPLFIPVLFIIYKKLETTKRVFEVIKKAKPPKLYIAGDGPKEKKEEKIVKAVRDYILTNID